MGLNEIEFCRIGQKQRCGTTKCEWKKAFNHYCWLREPEVKKCEGNIHSEEKKSLVKKRKGRVVKEELKYTEIKPHKEIKEVEFENKFKTASTDNWIKKIKTL